MPAQMIYQVWAESDRHAGRWLVVRAVDGTVVERFAERTEADNFAHWLNDAVAGAPKRAAMH